MAVRFNNWDISDLNFLDEFNSFVKIVLHCMKNSFVSDTQNYINETIIAHDFDFSKLLNSVLSSVIGKYFSIFISS